MKISVFLLFLFLNEIVAFTSKQLMERLHYIEDRLNDESKFRREDFSAVCQELVNIKTKLDQTFTTNKENKVTEDDSVPDETYTVKHESNLLKAFKAEKIVNTQFRRELPILKRHVQEFEATTEKLETLFKENILNLEKQFQKVMKTTGETLADIIRDVNELKTLQNMYINMTLVLTDTLRNGDLYCTVKESTSTMTTCAKESTFSTPPLPMESTTTENIFSSCKDAYDKGNSADGIYNIAIRSGKSISLYCDMTTDGGGWTVFQRRKDGNVDFFLNWDEYKVGFGDVNGEFWLGNEYLNILTDTVEQHELRVDMEDFEGNRAYAKYNRFKIGPESNNYKLGVSGYTGNAGDSLENPSRHVLAKHNGMEFTTKDRDNDKKPGGNCANDFHGAWWYNNCFESNLNSLYHVQSVCKTTWKCIVWNTWKGSTYSIKFTEMKFR